VSKTGARRPPASPEAPPPPGAQRATYRGVRWQRNPDAAVGWYKEDLEKWVRWRPKAGHPPPPPRWVAEGIPAPAVSSRPRWRSPYRIVPIVLVIAVCVIGVLQATKSTTNPVASEKAAAEKLVGKCLAEKGTDQGHPAYSPSPVPCELPVADVKVKEVLPGMPGSPRCPAGTTAVQLSYRGVRYPHVECVEPVKS
jgi:hypothetical protein